MHSWLCLFCFITKAFLFTRGQNMLLIKYSIMEIGMEMACICMHFQTIKYSVPICNILLICQWWQILFMTDSKFTPRYGDGSTALFFEDD